MAVEGIATSISELKSAVKDYVRPNYFEVVFPTSPVEPNHEGRKLVGILVKNINIPSINIYTIDIARMGKPIKYPGDFKYGELTINFRIDDEMMVYDYCKKWLDAMNNTGPEWGGDPTDFTKGDIRVYQLDRKLQRQKMWKFFNIWPTLLGEIQFSMDSENEVSEFPCTFAYSHYEFGKPDQQRSS